MEKMARTEVLVIQASKAKMAEYVKPLIRQVQQAVMAATAAAEPAETAVMAEPAAMVVKLSFPEVQ